MPTGYTQFIEDGDITTGKDFLYLCTRNFGISMSIMDESLEVKTPTHFKPDMYYYEQYSKALLELQDAMHLTIESARSRMKEEHSKRVADYIKIINRSKLINSRYAKVRKEVEDWIPPTEEHSGIKKFALEQIDMCIVPSDEIAAYEEKVSCNLDDCDESVKTYIDELIMYCRDNVDAYQRRWREELERTKSKNKFMGQFVKSFEEVVE